MFWLAYWFDLSLLTFFALKKVDFWTTLLGRKS